MAKRTTAQRRAAAKKAWALRKLRSADAPTPTNEGPWVTPRSLEAASRLLSSKLPEVFERAATADSLPPVWSPAPIVNTPATAVATKEGQDYYVTVSTEGSLFRHKVSRDTMRSLGLDCIKHAV